MPPSDRAPIGVVAPRDLPADRLRDFVTTADSAGFRELWVVEDLSYSGGIAQAAAALAWSDGLHVGIGILPAGVRNPAFLAMEIATLAGVFPGRVTIGLGHGVTSWMRQVGAWPASPLTLMRETAEALRALLRGERVTVTGRYVHLDGVALDRPPSVVPRIIAGVRGPRSLALAGESMDGVMLAEPSTPELLTRVREQIGAAAGDRFLLPVYNLGFVDDDSARAVDAARAAVAGLRGPDWTRHIDPLPFAREWRELDRAHPGDAEFAAAMPASWVETLALAGTPERVRGRIEEILAAGATSVSIFPHGEDRVAALDSLARVLPG
ncbi:LLM class flavin-dependent oxidoreductase [Pseudactinotalea sp. HY160]|uniref:LLM class flavin-dependent oxidoreductase n=1 Tax=Pseudactinotalea sp. HY160 TaxID=2654490 RepID=UPI00128C868C|nr:LLM class flavin-dependent oxidoreductase [Pseudactinotalea sp. HY160]MPV51405.1 LLM class flavin-dependent oxidoreductase [Pseudactinotalea sp. HY160]